jgi:IS4 transposase
VLFSSIVELMGAVVRGAQPSVRAAYLATLGASAAALTALSEKLKGLETGVCRAFVLDNAGRLTPLVRQRDATLPQPVPGYRATILDGHHRAGTEHRVPATRATRAAAVPGQSLVVLDPATMLVLEVVPCEDAHAQERSLIDPVLPGIESGDRGIADRNFGTTRLLVGTRAGGGSFVVRPHQSTLSWKETTPWAALRRAATGTVSEPTVTITEADGSGAITVRRIRLDLDQPTRDKEKELFLLTDVPRERADALTLADAYRKRWRLENVFQTLSEALVCEINTLVDPKAALFGFGVAAVAYHVLATVRAALRSEHGRAAVEAEVSNDHLANEVATRYEGMMIAVPPSEWAPRGRLSLAELAEFLREGASQAWLAKYPRTVRGPKKPPPKRTSGRTNHHVSTARLLQRQIQQK